MCEPTDATSNSNSTTKEENVRHGKCLNASQILKLDCNSSVVEFNCSLPQFIEFPPDELHPEGSNRTFYAPKVTGDGEPLAVTVTCPGRVPECKFWDANISDWAGDGCAVASYTNSSITCECTHLTDFAGATGDVGSTAGSVVEMGLALSLTDLLNALTVLITLLLALALFAALWARGVMDDKADERDRHALREAVLPGDTVKKEPTKISRTTERVALAAAFRTKERRPWLLTPSVFKAYARHAMPVKRYAATALHGFVTAMRREHKILQIFHLPDGNYTRAERVTVLAVLIFATLAANALFLSVAPPFTIGGTEASIHNAPHRPTTHVAKVFYSSIAAMFSTFFYLGFAFLFSKTGEKNSDVDHFLGVDPGNLARENRVRVRKRRRVLDALAALDHARDAQKAVFHDLAEELQRLHHFAKDGDLGEARALTSQEHHEFSQLCVSKRASAAEERPTPSTTETRRQRRRRPEAAPAAPRPGSAWACGRSAEARARTSSRT